MGFRFQRRINLGGGLGLNLSKSGIGASVRSKHGSIGTSGFSFRTGIPGLSFRQGWGKGGQGALAGIAVVAFTVVAIAVATIAIRVLIVLGLALWEGGRWCALTAHDYLEYRRTGGQIPAAVQPSPPEDPTAAPEPTLAEIMAKSRSGGDRDH